MCGDAADCESGVCNNGICSPCSNSSECLDGQYCDSDSGICKPGSVQGEDCTAETDCETDNCVDGVCCNTACENICEACNLTGTLGTCTAITAGEDPEDECTDADTCNGSASCYCSDGMTNNGEPAQDCGGSCSGCADGSPCDVGSDCESLVCNLTCQIPACDDLAQNGQETDVDCGGGCPNACDVGDGCLVNTDCTSGICDNLLCTLPTCGDGIMNVAGEECDDDNTDSYDGCSANCLNPSDHLLISELVVTPTEGEFVEIYNPTAATVMLDQFYLADYDEYYLLTTGSFTVPSSDMLVQFPAASEIASESFAVISLKSATIFNGVYGDDPDFDLDPMDNGAPAMTGTYPSNAVLTNGDEMLVLFRWDGVSNLVEDFDYVVWGNTSDAMNKTGAMAGGDTYNDETPTAMQSAGSAPPDMDSLHRCDTAEDSESAGGNGVSGQDETSEDFATGWKVSNTPSPGVAPDAGFCP